LRMNRGGIQNKRDQNGRSQKFIHYRACINY
jgi:hypothetical protein